MNEYRIPPVRVDSQAMSMSALGQQVDWGLKERNMPEQWSKGAGEGVLVVILDTGVPRHRDLPKPEFTFNFTNSLSDFDHNSHQTHCAGIVAAMNNDLGVVGWAPKATLAHIKVLGDNGAGATSWIEQGILQATKAWRARRNHFTGCIISMSLGGPFDPDQEEAIMRAEEAGILVVAAAGNSGFRMGQQSTVDHPGSSPYTIGVASYRRDGVISRFSSGGSEVDIAMPGEEVLSTVPGDRYQVMSGTSMATPAAAGLFACAISSRPGDTEIQTVDGMRAFLQSHSEDRGEPGKDKRFGWGVPKADELVRDQVYWFF